MTEYEIDEQSLRRFEINEKSLRMVEEGLSKMESSARKAFAELFPKLDYDNDFSENINFSDIEQLFEIVEKAHDEKGYERYGSLRQLMLWTLQGLYLSPAQAYEFAKKRNKFMIERKNEGDLPKKAVELLNRLEEFAKPAFKKIFPNLDYNKDFQQNKNIDDIEEMYKTIEKLIVENNYKDYCPLHDLLGWRLDALIDEEYRKDAIELVKSLDKKTKIKFLRWMLRRGYSREEAENLEIQAEVIGKYFSEMMFKK